MADETINRVMEELETFHKFQIPVYFSPMGLGEPLLFSKLYETFERVKAIAKKIPIVLVTNGVSLTEDHCERILHCAVDEVSVSLNANLPSVYEQHMGLDKYEIVCKNIRTLINTRNKLKQDNPRIFIQYIDDGNTNNSFSRDMHEWAKIMKGQDKCYVHPIVNQGGFFKHSSIDFKFPQHYPCSQPVRRIALRVNGDIYPCDPAFYAGGNKIESLYLGNIMSSSPFELFTQRGGKRGEIMSLMRKSDYSQLPECDRCDTYRLSPNTHFSLPFSIKLNGFKWF